MNRGVGRHQEAGRFYGGANGSGTHRKEDNIKHADYTGNYPLTSMYTQPQSFEAARRKTAQDVNMLWNRRLIRSCPFIPVPLNNSRPHQEERKPDKVQGSLLPLLVHPGYQRCCQGREAQAVSSSQYVSLSIPCTGWLLFERLCDMGTLSAYVQWFILYSRNSSSD